MAQIYEKGYYMPKVQFTTVTEVEMDEYNPTDIKEMGKSISQAGQNDVSSICQSVEVVSVTAKPILEEIDCLAVDDIPEL